MAPSHPVWSNTFWGLREKVGAGSRPESMSEVSLALLNILGVVSRQLYSRLLFFFSSLLFWELSQ